jgi:hypothetical protein
LRTGINAIFLVAGKGEGLEWVKEFTRKRTAEKVLGVINSLI